MTIKEFREKSVSDLEKLIADSRVELREARFAVKEGKEKNVRKLRVLTKTIAKAISILAEKKRQTAAAAKPASVSNNPTDS